MTTARTTVGRLGARRLRRRLTRVRRAVRERLHALPEDAVAFSSAAQWLFENEYLLLRTADALPRDLPPPFAARLRTARDGTRDAPHAPHTRVERIADALLDDRTHPLDVATLRRRLRERPDVDELDLAELWALPVLLRLRALETILDASDPPGRIDRAGPDADRRVRAAVLTVQRLDRADWREVVEAVSLVEARLRRDPAGVYPRLDANGRDRYRSEIERLARRARASELAVADAVLAAAHAPERPGATRHVGHVLFGDGADALAAHLGVRPTPRDRLVATATRHPLATLRRTAAVPATATWAATVAAAWPHATPLATLLLAALTAVAYADLFDVVVRHLAAHLLPPRVLPKLDLRDGLPPDAATWVVMPVLVHDEHDVADAYAQLERHARASVGGAVAYALLADLPDADAAHAPGDAALTAALTSGLAAVRARTPDAPFALALRSRRYAPSEGRWMGWERKRGKLMAWNAWLLRGERGDFTVLDLPDGAPPDPRYVLTLDADTVLPPDALARLVGAAAHPLAHAHLDDAGRVVHGYTVLQPRIEPLPPTEPPTRFARDVAGARGVDPYAHAISEPIMALTGEGAYTGKGLYDLAAFDTTLSGRMPDGAILSHDLLEGGLGRTALVADVVLLEPTPTTYDAWRRRERRWVRGDWQLLPWLLRRPAPPGGPPPAAPLSPAARAVARHNLRRSLRAPVALALLALAWSGALPAGAAVAPAVLAWLAAPVAWPGWGAVRRAWRGRTVGAPVAAARLATDVAFLPVQAWTHATAIARTLHRVYRTRRGLLQWTTAARDARTDGDRSVRVAPVAAGAAALLLVVAPLADADAAAYARLASALPWIVAWAAAPRFAAWLARPVAGGAPDAAPATEADRAWWWRIARRTWGFFERYVGPEDHWLPPDHVQLDPTAGTAHRTSPTNVGMALNATWGAWDLGFLSARAAVLRLRNALATLDRLERWHGHLLNWYDTRTLAPLAPRYVSTVDSGNLVAALVALRSGLRELEAHGPLDARAWRGAEVVLDLVDEARAALPGGARDGGTVATAIADVRAALRRGADDPAAAPALLDALHTDLLPHLATCALDAVEADGDPPDEAALADLGRWLRALHDHVASLRRDRDAFLPWTDPALAPGTDAAGPGARPDLPTRPTYAELDAAYDALAADAAAASGTGGGVPPARLAAARTALAEVRDDVRRLEAAIDAIVDGTRWDVLYDPRTHLLRLGWHVDDDRADANAYDLLASEARIASFLAVATHQVPAEHWVHLGRPCARAGRDRVLLSWSGTTFEYLMPALWMRPPPGTLLDAAEAACVRRQRAFGAAHDLPWGVSESSYARRDPHGGYRYHAFGVPDLALAHPPTDRRVVAPYATHLGLLRAPAAATAALRRFARLGAYGPLGFYEAVDATPAHLPAGTSATVVRTWMAHHQGMSFLALCHVLDGPRFVERFHADARVAAHAPLLAERIPTDAPVRRRPRPARPPRRPPPSRERPTWQPTLDDPAPQVHGLSNGRLTSWVGAAGGGGLRWGDLDVTRWQPDATRDPAGVRLYLLDAADGVAWSPTRAPCGPDPEVRDEAVTWSADRGRWTRRRGDVVATLEAFVAPDVDADVRIVTLENRGDDARHLAVASYGEVVLGPHAADLRHPAFENLFVRSETWPDVRGVAFRRTPRERGTDPVWALHRFVAGPGSPTDGGPTFGPVTASGDRAALLDRHDDPADPSGLRRAPVATDGDTLDPAFVLRTDVTLPPHATARFALVTSVARSGEALRRGARAQGTWAWIEEAGAGATRRADAAAAQRRMDGDRLAGADRLASRLLVPTRDLRAAATTLGAAPQDPRALWALGPSGDLPLLVLRVAVRDDLRRARTLLAIHRWWRDLGFAVDLVLLDERDVGYEDATRTRLERAVAEADAARDAPGGVHVVRRAAVEADVVASLLARAEVVLGGEPGPGWAPPAPVRPAPLPALAAGGRPVRAAQPPAPPPAPPSLGPLDARGGPPADGAQAQVTTGWGTLRRDGAFELEVGGRSTPAPWANVLANERFGTLVDEAGAMSSWFENAGEFRLTPWSNDPRLAPSGETVYLRDEASGEVWTATPRPAPGEGAYRVVHAFGATTFQHRHAGLAVDATVAVDPERPAKVVRLEVRNEGDAPRRVTATAYLEWVLGAHRTTAAAGVVPAYDPDTGVLSATSGRDPDFADVVAFLATDRPPHGLTCDRHEFLGTRGDPRAPAALGRVGLSGRVAPGDDPCAALQVHLDLPPGGRDAVAFVVGADRGRDAAHAHAAALTEAGAAERTIAAAQATWRARLGQLRVRTPDPAFDAMTNGRWLHQTWACRLLARTATYQSSGAYGFRDQLQDGLALLHVAPEVLRARLIEAAAHQFEAGDVLHWWLPPSGRGVRTRISDDLAWLPYALAAYVEATGDRAVLDVRRPFLRGAPLPPDVHERFDAWRHGEADATLYEHAARALERAATEGPHGLPRIGTGDWNDGMNRVGAKGRGESVWLAWFLIRTLRDVAPYAEARGEGERAARWRAQADAYRAAVEAHAWAGDRYLRAYYDDGTPMGGADRPEARIDAIAQAWAVLSGAGDPARAREALATAWRTLVDPDAGLARLLHPPFGTAERDPAPNAAGIRARHAHPRDPGYVGAYPPGVRENGGQYTHAALWLAWAALEAGGVAGDPAAGSDLFAMLNPLHHTGTPDAVARYRVEPYVMAADVYGWPPHVGRGGWTWYTGSAGWAYRLAVEGILGLRREGAALRLAPHLPPTWNEAEVAYAFGASTFRLHYRRADDAAAPLAVTCDGVPCAGGRVPLHDDGGAHEVHVTVPGVGTSAPGGRRDPAGR